MNPSVVLIRIRQKSCRWQEEQLDWNFYSLKSKINMTRNFTFVIMVLAFFFTGMKASADGEHTFSMQADYGAWAATSEPFEMSVIAEELGVDTETLSSAIQDWQKASYNSDFFMLKHSDGSWSYERGNAGDGAFYIDQDGNMLEGWGSAAAYCRLDIDDTTISITIGQTRNLESGTIKATCSINYNGQTVVFNPTLTVGTPDLDIDKEPVTAIASLNIVGKYTYKCTQSLYDSWYDVENSIPVTGISEALGIDSVYMKEHLSSMLFTKDYDSDNEIWAADLIHKFTSTPNPGFWFDSGVWDEATQTEGTELILGSYSAETNKFYIAEMSYNTGTDAIDCIIGQYPGHWELKENRQADIYIVYGDKAYVLTIDLTVDMELDPITNYNKIGEKEFIVNRDPRGGWDVTDSIPVNIAEIVATFQKAGAENVLENMGLYANDSHGSITNNYTADNAGFWMTADNTVTSYSANAANIFIELLNDSVNPQNWYLKIGNTPNKFNGGEEFNSTLYLINGKNYYQLNVKLTMDNPQYTLSQCEIIEHDLTVQFVPLTDSWEIGSTDVSDIDNLLGTTTGTFYGMTAAGDTTANYSVTEASTYGGGGFWMSAADSITGMAYAAGYTGNGAYAIWYYQSTIHWFNVPGLPVAGDVCHGTFFIADHWNGKAIKLNVTLKYVSEVITPVGTEEVSVLGRSAEDDVYEQEFSLAAACEKLGCTEEELNESGEWLVKDANGNLIAKNAENFDDMYGFSFDAQGNTVGATAVVFYAGYSDGVFKSYILDDVNMMNTYKTVIYLKYNNKYYEFDVIVNETDTGISSVDEASDDTTVYDLTGRKVLNPSKGIYVKGGKKILVK